MGHRPCSCAPCHRCPGATPSGPCADSGSYQGYPRWCQPSPECMLCPGSRRPSQGRPGEPVPRPRACPPTRRHDRQQAPSGGGRRPRAVAAIGVGWVCGRRVGAGLRGAGCLLGTWGNGGLGTLSPGIQQAAVARDRALLAARDVAVLKAVGMSRRGRRTGRAAIGRPHRLMTQLARQVGNRPPPFAFDVLHPTTLYPLGVMALPSPSPAPWSLPVEPPAAGPPRSCDRSEAACVLFQRA
jgi:hypothetical protein